MLKPKRKHVIEKLVESRFEIANSYSSFRNYYSETFYCGGFSTSIEAVCKSEFDKFPFPGNYLDYDAYCSRFSFPSCIKDKHIDVFLGFCEFLLNFVGNAKYLEKHVHWSIFNEFSTRCRLLSQKITETLDSLGYEILIAPEYHLFYCVEKNAPAKKAAAIDFVEDQLSASYKIIEYNRTDLKGDISRKRDILLTLCRIFESKRSELEKINKPLEKDLGFLINTFDIRHNNSDEGSSSKKEFVSKLSPAQMEGIYDMMYDLFLQAFISIDNRKYNESIKELLKKNGTDGSGKDKQNAR